MEASVKGWGKSVWENSNNNNNNNSGLKREKNGAKYDDLHKSESLNFILPQCDQT